MRKINRFLGIPFLMLLFFISCEQKTKTNDTTDNSIPFFNDSLFNAIKKVVPNGWRLTNDSAYTLVLISKDSLPFCNFTNSEDYAGDDYANYIKDKIIDKKPFQIRFTFREILTNKQIDAIGADNKKIDERLKAIYDKYGMKKLDYKFDQYVPRNSTDSLNLVNYNIEYEVILKERKSMPDLFTKHNSVYLSNNLPFPNSSLCFPEKEKEVEDLIYKIEDILMKE